jgi:hypothetical protein
MNLCVGYRIEGRHPRGRMGAIVRDAGVAGFGTLSWPTPIQSHVSLVCAATTHLRPGNIYRIRRNSPICSPTPPVFGHLSPQRSGSPKIPLISGFAYGRCWVIPYTKHYFSGCQERLSSRAPFELWAHERTVRLRCLCAVGRLSGWNLATTLKSECEGNAIRP